MSSSSYCNIRVTLNLVIKRSLKNGSYKQLPTKSVVLSTHYKHVATSLANAAAYLDLVRP